VLWKLSTALFVLWTRPFTGNFVLHVSVLAFSTPAHSYLRFPYLRFQSPLCTMFGRLMGWNTMYTLSGLLPPHGILPGPKLTLHPSLAFSYIGSVTARHWSSGRQRNFAAWDKEGNYGTFAPRLRHLYSARRPSRWASAHILVYCVYLPTCIIETKPLLCLTFEI